MPKPISAPEPWDAAQGTRLVLPFRADNESAKHQWKQIKPHLLLFLHRLQCISFTTALPDITQGFHFGQTASDKPVSERFAMSKEVDADGTVVLREVTQRGGAEPTTTSHNWLIVEQSIQPRHQRTRGGDSLLTIAETLLALAFKVDSRDAAQPLEPLPVFCFLPLRSFGFKFIVQA